MNPQSFLWLFRAAAAVILALMVGAAHAVVVMKAGPYRMSSHGWTGAGGEYNPTKGDIRLIGSMGGTGIARTEGGSYILQTGIVGAVEPAQANLDHAHAFPSPFMPSRGHTAITFSQLTANVTIRIYTLNGELVKEIFKRAPGIDRIRWHPVQNEQGQDIASGVYLFVMESSEGQVKTGKLMVIK